MITRSTFKVLFYLKKNVQKPDGTVPIMCRITVDGKAVQFSCKRNVNPEQWDTKNGKAIGRTVEAGQLNTFLENLKIGLSKSYQYIFDHDDYVSAEKVRNNFLGLDVAQDTILSLFRQFNADYKNQVGTIKTYKSYTRYAIVYNHLAKFLRLRYKVNDYVLKELKPSFITDFEIYLRSVCNLATNTIFEYMIPVKKIATIAHNEGLIQRNPFADYHCRTEKTKRGYLSKEELQILINAKFKKGTHDYVRDLFVFCCFTGLSFIDLYNLKQENIKKSFDGHTWIITKRQKTDVPVNVRLLDIPLRIIEKYKGMAKDGKIFVVPRYINLLCMLKTVIKKSGIQKHVTWHMSRHTFATTVTLSNGVPIETVSKMLGHTDIKTTQIYAKITNEKISVDMEQLSTKLDDFGIIDIDKAV